MTSKALTVFTACTAEPVAVEAEATAASATSIWAPYGRMPCTMHPKISRSDAVFCGVMLYSLLICFAMGAAMTIATVLFAVATSKALTKRPTPSCPLLWPLNTLWIKSSRAANPPWMRISPQRALTRTATMMVSYMPEMPFPIWPRSPTKSS